MLIVVPRFSGQQSDAVEIGFDCFERLFCLAHRAFRRRRRTDAAAIFGEDNFQFYRFRRFLFGAKSTDALFDCLQYLLNLFVAVLQGSHRFDFGFGKPGDAPQNQKRAVGVTATRPASHFG